MTCPFCGPDQERVVHEAEDFICLWDAFPVSAGHGLVVSRRHIANWFDATTKEQINFLQGIELLRHQINEKHSPDGFNIGINIGAAAGQTIPHLHIHVIPRYSGDVLDPRGGVRYVIPEKGNYLLEQKGVSDGEKTYSHFSGQGVHGNEEFPFLNSITKDIADASILNFAIAFVTASGLEQLEPFFVDLFDRQGQLRLLTGDYLDVTEPRALLLLLDWMQEYPEQVEVRVFQTDSELGFHPKAYLIQNHKRDGIAYIGSSNLTKHALTRGLEWNQRIVGPVDGELMTQAITEFERLFNHAKTNVLDQAWIDNYKSRRQFFPPHSGRQVIDINGETTADTPTPNEIQVEALQALLQTRRDANRAGLVVMATGLGKTWLAAFDTVQFTRVLFVAHREEILTQAHQTFRKIRPDTKFGVYGGGSYDHRADVIFASIQTLGRQNHLNRFDPGYFDYIVVDEFHHACAKTYRRLIDHFDPKFLLGLTATPDRSDGGDLLGLCGENLVFRCDLHAGINREILSPFHYFGVPDEIDFDNIPWRSGKFDLEKLELAVATNKRAQNAFGQWKKRAQRRTLAFCVSKRHADFMTTFFKENGVNAAAVHSGTNSSPRTQTLQQLERNELQIVFAVDMFNEGVDIPTIDTVMMLRPTESRILWLQQLGRGLRKAEGKTHLNVIDYIGNHRTFLQIPMLLFPGLGQGNGEISRALEAAERGELNLPLGCAVEYELEALNILKKLASPTAAADQFTHWYRSFQEQHERRPLASEAWHAGYDPRRVRPSFGSWLGFVKSENGLTEFEEDALEKNREFLTSLETTQMTKSYKIVTLLAMIAEENFPDSISIKKLAFQAKRIASRVQLLANEFDKAISDHTKMRQLLEKNSIDAWVGARGTKGTKYFDYKDGIFSTIGIGAENNEALRILVQEICDYRLSMYLDRLHGEMKFAASIACNVSHSSGVPMVFLPPREKNPGIPDGWTTVNVGDIEYQANFLKITVNEMREKEGGDNFLPQILRSFFGDEAGKPGNSHHVMFEMMDGRYVLRPLSLTQIGAQAGKEYMRADIPPLFGFEFNTGAWNQGYLQKNEHIFLLVTLNKSGMSEGHSYKDNFVSEKEFEWVSQNQMTRTSPSGQKLENHKAENRKVHLFVRDKKVTPAGTGSPFVFCGDLDFVSWDGDKPIVIRWHLKIPLTKILFERFSQVSKLD